MDRIIEVKVSGGYLSLDGRKAGNQHEANATRLRITFDPSWDGYAKTVTFWNANGMHQVKRILTADRLEDQSKNARVYLCPIPGEAMTESGLMTFTIDGYVNGVRKRTAGANLGVDRSPYTENAADPADPTPSQAEQLQAQIENLLNDVREEVGNAEGWAAKAQAEADRATVPAVEGVYNIILVDRVTGGKYALIAEGGTLKLLSVSYNTQTHEPVLLDSTNRTAYQLIAEGGVLKLLEV